MRYSPAIQISLALILACLASSVMAEDTARARFLGSFPWVMDKPWFGGWSGIELSGDGREMTAINDRGRILKAGISRQGGQITGITPHGNWRLKASTGKFLASSIIDSEGLAIAADGTVLISFEGVTRVVRYTEPAALAKVLRLDDLFRELPKNKSLEALAIDHTGCLFAIPERLLPGGIIQVFVLDNGIWSTPFGLVGGDGFLPVGADFDHKGRFYLLERAWSILGFRTRVRRWDMVDGELRNEALLVQTRTRTHDNLEGLAVWRDKQGRTRLTMIADDNFLWLQHTEIVEYVLQD